MTRGNAREIAREKNRKREAEKKKGVTESTPFSQRKERDAEFMRQKQAAAEARKAEQSTGAASSGKKKSISTLC